MHDHARLHDQDCPNQRWYNYNGIFHLWRRRLLADLFSLASAKETGAQGQETLTEIMYTGKNIAIGMARQLHEAPKGQFNSFIGI